jgi:hypothetical protein
MQTCEMNYLASENKDGNNNYWCEAMACNSRTPFNNKSCSLTEDIKNVESENTICYYYEKYDELCEFPCETTNLNKKCVSECPFNFENVFI